MEIKAQKTFSFMEESSKRGSNRELTKLSQQSKLPNKKVENGYEIRDSLDVDEHRQNGIQVPQSNENHYYYPHPEKENTMSMQDSDQKSYNFNMEIIDSFMVDSEDSKGWSRTSQLKQHIQANENMFKDLLA